MSSWAVVQPLNDVAKLCLVKALRVGGKAAEGRLCPGWARPRGLPCASPAALGTRTDLNAPYGSPEPQSGHPVAMDGVAIVCLPATSLSEHRYLCLGEPTAKCSEAFFNFLSRFIDHDTLCNTSKLWNKSTPNTAHLHLGLVFYRTPLLYFICLFIKCTCCPPRYLEGAVLRRSLLPMKDVCRTCVRWIMKTMQKTSQAERASRSP